VQEETTFLGIPCFTLRNTTERPVTVRLGTNVLLGLEPARIDDILPLLRTHARTTPAPPPLWDGAASSRVADVLEAIETGERHLEAVSV
jgi:UDP-N-acetylglucosamine 2-epimerase (non-hydrolysing)